MTILMLENRVVICGLGYVKTSMTIPQFKNIWDKTKEVHGLEFGEFIDS